MRITNSTLASEALNGFQAQLRALDDARRQASTGIRVAQPSDDPVAMAGVMRSNSGLRALEQYQRNLSVGQSRLNVEDSTLNQLSDALSRAKELGLSQGGDTASAATRAAAGAEVAGLVDFATDLANTQFGGAYVFGGQYADTAPYSGGAWDPARPPEGDFKLEIGARRFVNTNHSAKEIFIDTDVVDGLQALTDALRADDTDATLAAVTRLDVAFDKVQGIVGELGARMNALDVAVSNLDSLEINLQTFRADLEEADMTEAVTRLVERQGALEAAMLANSKILNLTLTDYLR